MLVVVMHASLFFPESLFFKQFDMVAAGVRMPLLMFVTGYLFTTTSAPGKRLFQFAWILALWTLITVIAQNVDQPGQIPFFFAREFIFPTSAMWFVWSAGFMGLSLLALRNVHIGLVLAATAFLTMLNEAGLFGIELYTFEHSVGNAFFFYFGAYYGATILRLLHSEWRKILLFGPALMLMLRGVDYWAVQTFGWQVIGIPERIVAILFVLTFARWLASKAEAITASMAWIGRNTMPIFVAHNLFIIPGAAMFATFQPEIAIVLLTVSMVAVSLALHRFAFRCGLDWMYAVPVPLLQAAERWKDLWRLRVGGQAEALTTPSLAVQRRGNRRGQRSDEGVV